MVRKRKKIEPGSAIPMKTSKNESPWILEWLNHQSIPPIEALRFLIEKDINENQGIADLGKRITSVRQWENFDLEEEVTFVELTKGTHLSENDFKDINKSVPHPSLATNSSYGGQHESIPTSIPLNAEDDEKNTKEFENRQAEEKVQMEKSSVNNVANESEKPPSSPRSEDNEEQEDSFWDDEGLEELYKT